MITQLTIITLLYYYNSFRTNFPLWLSTLLPTPSPILFSSEQPGGGTKMQIYI